MKDPKQVVADALAAARAASPDKPDILALNKAMESAVSEAMDEHMKNARELRRRAMLADRLAKLMGAGIVVAIAASLMIVFAAVVKASWTYLWHGVL